MGEPKGSANTARMVPVQRIRADLLLMHAPAFFDFRERRDIYFPFLSTSGDVPITPLYEYFPVGFRALQQHLGQHGHEVRIINLASVMLKYPTVDIDRVLCSADVSLVGIDLHWMVHVQGALAVAERLRSLRPELPIIFGGISSSFYAEELIRYPFVDMVMRGYDTLAPMQVLMDELKGERRLARVPNLLWKSETGEVHDNGLTHTPREFSCGVDWSQQPAVAEGSMPIRELITTQTAGCSFHCGWCGGSREAFRRIFGRTMARKPQPEVRRELGSVLTLPKREQYFLYAVGSYNEPPPRLEALIDQIGEVGLRRVSYEQFHLPSDEVMRRMVRASPHTTLTLSPESHDLEISRRAGRGVYTNEELEAWIERALAIGIEQVDIWYFVGMPGQDERSVRETVDYCGHLLRRFAGARVVPLICPMIPFLDPASTFFMEPEAHGYRVFHRTVEEHRRAMERPSLIHRLNYETRWLSREQLVTVGYSAVRQLLELKGEAGLPRSLVEAVTRPLDDALAMIREVHRADSLADPAARAAALRELEGEILRRNRTIFSGSVANTSFPIQRPVGGRWFDELLYEYEEERVTASPAA